MAPAAAPPFSSAAAALRAARAGDLHAFNQLVAEHQAAIYSLACRVLGDEAAAVEATQAAFVSALRQLDAYRGGSFRLWVLRWLVAACRPRLAQRTVPPPGADVAAAMAALPPAQRLALALVDLAGLDYAQAAAVLGLSTTQLSCDLAAARRALTASLVAP